MAETANEALLTAAENGSLRGVKAALEAGADIDYVQPGSLIEGRNTALLIASFLGHVDVVKLLLRKGASLTKRDAVASSAPLHGAAREGHTEVVDLLVHHGATLDIRDGHQTTPLMAACMYKRVGTVRRLIDLGARVDLTDYHGFTAKGYCFFGIVGEVGDRDCMKMLKLIQEAMETRLLRCCNPMCGKPGYRSTLKLCAQCKLTRYCSRDCQKQHWTVGHKKSCGHDAYTGETPNLLDCRKLVESTVGLPN
ncbi:PREDICTED: serine/threonine-protein phosphatase 6 regulatory ankyrin repeat subunit A-like [Branchiostoma belcheri]|uniref:Serine/threonine-protein phosphatase 6 regulatory ankyrin repeat subunit A-like n=1 Tax=Branchiostoma belcheri TaxID=7741 RepID=A0A6P5AXU5_BRABE|nr:PREDICTED: serine/threonine-protein phosphatase 6 regulatory ankyrin repeat subunit A-like [Branchiostoma belcheri]